MRTLIAASLCLIAVRNSKAIEIDYARDVLPVLERHCYSCHDGKKQTSGYRLDVRSRAFAGGESGETAIAPGSTEKSSLVARVRGDDPSLLMPPEGEGERLSSEEIEVLSRWVKQGATWPDALANESKKETHWAFIAPVKPSLPEVRNKQWLKNVVDSFVLARLEAEGLQPSSEAEKTALIRRLSLDLIGLPPSIEEVDAFLADESRDAYQQVVERLLASPHYGERWGRIWLDAARYADSDGYEKDSPRQVWFYRDWVINAFNRDLRYDEFVVDQIAGDLRPNANQDSIVATGFLRNSMANEEGGIDVEQFRTEAMFDRIDAIGKSMLGLTIQCAQCHNHKYDPLTQEEYYRIFAFLNDSHEASICVYTREEQSRQQEILQQIAEIEAGCKKSLPDWRQRMRDWELSVQNDQPSWQVVNAVPRRSGDGLSFERLKDGSLLSQAYSPARLRLDLDFAPVQEKVSAIRLELLCHPTLARGGPGRSVYGTAAITELELAITRETSPGRSEKLRFRTATSDVNLPRTKLPSFFDDLKRKQRVIGPPQMAIDGDTNTAWGTDVGPGRRNQPFKAVFVLEEPIECDEKDQFTVTLVQHHGGWNLNDNHMHNVGRFRLSTTDVPDPVADPLPAVVRESLATPRRRRNAAQTAAVFSYWRTTVDRWREANEAIEQLWRKHPEGESQLVYQQRGEPRETFLLKRGDFLSPDRQVTPGVPAFLHPLPSSDTPSRLDFARWIVDRRSPTTARSFVNRVWQAYFGVGLAESSEDLGVQSQPPSHSDLLDWLAVEFMDQAWSMKQLHRLIVTSATYRQSSRVSAELLAKDPYNRLLARGPRLRVDAELVRDIALATSGLLQSDVGGPSVYPPIPSFLLRPPASYGDKAWPVSTGAERYRRAMYTFRFRTLPYPILQTFDAPSGEVSCIRRPRSNTPLQALMTLNEPMSVECARALANRVWKEASPDPVAQVRHLFRLCLSRTPSASELERLLAFLELQQQRLKSKELDSASLLGPDLIASLPNEQACDELAGLASVARVILNLDETISKE